MGKAGRPPKAENDKKNIRVEIRLNQQEDALLTELSEKYQLSKTDTILKALEVLQKKKK